MISRSCRDSTEVSEAARDDCGFDMVGQEVSVRWGKRIRVRLILAVRSRFVLSGDTGVYLNRRGGGTTYLVARFVPKRKEARAGEAKERSAFSKVAGSFSLASDQGNGHSASHRPHWSNTAGCNAPDSIPNPLSRFLLQLPHFASPPHTPRASRASLCTLTYRRSEILHRHKVNSRILDRFRQKRCKLLSVPESLWRTRRSTIRAAVWPGRCRKGEDSKQGLVNISSDYWEKSALPC